MLIVVGNKTTSINTITINDINNDSAVNQRPNANIVNKTFNYQKKLAEIYDSGSKFVTKLHTFSNFSRSDVYCIRKFVEDLVLNPVINFIEESQMNNCTETPLSSVLCDRTLLISTITQYLDLNGCEVSLSDCAELEKQICTIFKTEELNYLRNKKSEEANFECEATEYYAVLVQTLRSDKITADDFDLYWRKCAPLRFKQIAEAKTTTDILNLWPEYTKPSAFQFSQKPSPSFGTSTNSSLLNILLPPLQMEKKLERDTLLQTLKKALLY
ncbi:hypothetical protein FF38_01757 [Lucilia cuprina]|uniref:Uncharacterized protein n=1 Tax=Lucilia cuprina TaxID=7375 RepID=A0A0L0BSS5_LUCCU|nr:hypothetical protein FF38_01757 [Lucilia cuprina]